MKQIGIIGGGWLGQPLAHFLANLGHVVTVSKTTSQGCKALTELGFHSVKLNLEDDLKNNLQVLKPLQLDMLIGCFPPGFRRGKGREYAEYWHKLVNIALQLKVRKVVMVSSTTVYPDCAGIMHEEQATLGLAAHNEAFSDNAKIMLEAEQTLIDSGLEYAIVRCSGLLGPNRNPANFASKLRQVSDRAPANMLHQIDAVGAVSFAALNLSADVVNATTPNTTNKAEFYQTALQRAGRDEALPPIVHNEDKLVSADKICQLGYRFHFQHTLELL
ncbi:NAD-dependent epimerase/dehydratase family protein [Vibrio scophthalmi]|uniref:Protein YeeZ n=1 Tax=Vibrio scophthalmi TaxID=45658 RepID=A0A1C7F7L8_9VIBR|nr:NAD-dependent epimerase/dehydratase family protein [Vibrio scophthalmi]ANU35950.1 Protein YeeZ [Vibrio scophthalmi]